MAHSQELKLPDIVSSPSDLRLLSRELDRLIDFLLQAQLVDQNQHNLKLPKVSRFMEQFSSINKLNLLHEADRQLAREFLNELNNQPWQLKVSLPSEPSALFVTKLTAWLRDNIQTNILLTIGLQPTIGVGCLLQTANKQFDFSLKHNLENQKQQLLTELLNYH